MGFADCNYVSHCFGNYTSLYDFDTCVEKKVHAFLHSMHAGFFDCSVDWGTYYDDNPSVTIQRLSFFANIIIQYSVDIDLYFSMDVPSSCTLGVDTVDTCLATSSQFTSVEQIDALNDTYTLDLMQDWYAAVVDIDMSTYNGLYIEKIDDSTSAWDGKYIPKGDDLTDEDKIALNRLLLKTNLFFGVSGPMATGAASNDPIFWVMHQIFDKMAQSLRLSPNYNRGNLTWNNHGNGLDGENWEGTTPFSPDIFSNLGTNLYPGTELLTNKQLWALLKPDGTDLPYVYDQFLHWGHCDFDPLEGVTPYPTAEPVMAPAPHVAR
mmetsp:Transcript_104779/g.302296  ORF Transcript_104779/g.302296 Transcript_104779/m.302296 type:complete len:321 (-) Transcript_104779:205-1167(-)